MEADYIARLAQLDHRLKELNTEKEKLLKEHDTTLDTMRRTLSEKDKVARDRQTKLESRIQELERIQENMKGLKTCGNSSDSVELCSVLRIVFQLVYWFAMSPQARRQLFHRQPRHRLHQAPQLQIAVTVLFFSLAFASAFFLNLFFALIFNCLLLSLQKTASSFFEKLGR